MACGCVCIATDVPGNRELIHNEESGLLIKPKDSGSIRDGIIRILRDENLQKKLAEKARKTVEKFSVENTLYKEIELVRKIMEETTNV